MDKILFIGSDGVIFKSVSALGSEFGFHVELAKDSFSALACCYENSYSMIITGIFNKGMDGIELTRVIKSSNSHSSTTPIMLLTSGENVDDLFPLDNKPDFIVHKDERTIEKIKSILKKLSQSNNEPNINILYIEDDKFIQKVVATWLKKFEYINLDFVISLEELHKLPNKSYDMIVSDNMIADGDFKDIIKYIQSSFLVDTPVLVYTGTVANLHFEELQKLGKVIDILPKPFEVKTFFKKLNAIKSLKT